MTGNFSLLNVCNDCIKYQTKISLTPIFH